MKMWIQEKMAPQFTYHCHHMLNPTLTVTSSLLTPYPLPPTHLLEHNEGDPPNGLGSKQRQAFKDKLAQLCMPSDVIPVPPVSNGNRDDVGGDLIGLQSTERIQAYLRMTLSHVTR